MRTLRHTTRSRLRRPRGAIGIVALGLIIALTATSMAIFATVSVTMNSSVKSRDFLHARENLDMAAADAVAAFDTHPPTTHTTATGSGHGEGHRDNRPSTWTWTRTAYDPANPTAGGQVEVHGTGGTTDQDRTLAWRTRLVGSQLDVNGEPTYGVAPASAWLATVSSEDNSYIAGTVTGDWHAYGVGKITVPSGSTVGRIISYDDAATFEGDPASFQRSTLSATLDERLLNQRVANCGTSLNRYVASQAGGVLNAGCYYSVVIDVPTVVTGGGAISVVSYGDIEIRANLTNQAGNQLHLYTASGTVKFRRSPYYGDPTVNAYVFAPNALCKTYATATVTFTGSLACRQIEMDGSFHQAPAPLPDLPPETPTPVTFLEGPGYADRFGD